MDLALAVKLIERARLRNLKNTNFRKELQIYPEPSENGSGLLDNSYSSVQALIPFKLVVVRKQEKDCCNLETYLIELSTA